METMSAVCPIIAMLSLCIAWGLIGISQWLSRRKATRVLNCSICIAIIGFVAVIVAIVIK